LITITGLPSSGAGTFHRLSQTFNSENFQEKYMRIKAFMAKELNNDALSILTCREIMLVLTTSVLVVLLAPDNVLDQFEILSRFVGKVSSWFPAIYAYQKKSAYPQVTGLYFAIFAFLTPALSLIPYRARRSFKAGLQGTRAKFPVRSILAVALLVSLGPLLLVGQYFFGWNFSVDYFNIGNSKIRLAMGGWIFFAGCAWYLVGSLAVFPYYMLRK
jgi:hypothetical protein